MANAESSDELPAVPNPKANTTPTMPRIVTRPFQRTPFRQPDMGSRRNLRLRNTVGVIRDPASLLIVNRFIHPEAGLYEPDA